MKIKSKGTGIYFTPQFWWSKAWQDCGENARELFFCLYNSINWTSSKKHGKQFTNHDQLVYTQAQFKEKYGCCNQTYTKARNQLIQVGLIRITYRGGNGRGDMTRYKLTYLGGESLPNGDDERWRLYDGEKYTWEEDIPKSRSKIGVKTRWKKGECGRNSKSNL